MISKQLKSNHFYGVSKNSSNSNVLLQISNFDFFKDTDGLPSKSGFMPWMDDCADQTRIRLTPDEARNLAVLLNKYADEIDATESEL